MLFSVEPSVYYCMCKAGPVFFFLASLSRHLWIEKGQEGALGMKEGERTCVKKKGEEGTDLVYWNNVPQLSVLHLVQFELLTYLSV